jgi:hypothetical protein
MKLNVDLLPKMDNYTDVHAMSLTPLMEGMHTLEALDMVRPVISLHVAFPSMFEWLVT